MSSQQGGSLAAPSPRPTGNPRQPSQDPPDGPTTGTGGTGGGNTAGERQTNVDQLMDAVGASGVDIGAEEEGLRATNERLKAQQLQRLNDGNLPKQGNRSREQTFIAPDALANVVKKIAAAFQLRTLEPDTIPLIALATRHRLASLINDAIAARDHRRFGSHLRPPPFTSKSKKRKRGLGAGDGDGNEDENEQDAEGEDEGDDGGGEDDDEDELFDFDFSTGQLVTEPKTGTGAAGRKRRKGKGTGGIGLDDDDAIEPAWDSVVFDDGEKLLGVLERVDREEERKKRRERMLRDQKEEEERALAEAIAASEAAEREAQGENGTGGGAGTAGNAAGNRASAGPSTPRPGAGGSGGGDETPVGLDKNGKPKKPSKKKKLDGTAPGSIKNMSEDVKKRLTDQTAMRSLGRKQFSWLNNGGGGGVGAGGFGSPSPALPRPKFAPASSLPPPTFATPNAHLSRTPGGGASNSDGLFSPLGSAGGGAVGAGGPGGFGLGPGPSTLSRLSHVPPLHDANRAQRQLIEWETSRTVVERDDLLFVLERERGAGIGRGSGRNVVLRAQAGIIKR